MVAIRVLCVDDELEQLELTRHFLRQHKDIKEVIIENDPTKVLSILERQNVDAIVSDYQMPGMDGIQLLHEVKGSRFDVPFIIFTGKGREDVAVHAYDGGADGYVQKGSDVKAMFAELTNRLIACVERRNALNDLRESEQRFRLMTENMRDSVWITDMDFKVKWMSPSAQRMRGFSIEELNELTVQEQMDPGSWETIKEAIEVRKVPERLMDPSDDLSLEGEFGFICKDGSVLWTDTVITLLRDREGNPQGLMGVGRDITDQKRTMKEREERQRKLDSLYSAGPIGMGFVRDRRYIEVNDRFLEMSGYERPEIIGQSTRVLYPDEEEYERVGREKYNDVKVNGFGTTETKWRRKDGKVIDVLLSSAGISPRSVEEGVSFTAVEITAQKDLENKLLEERHRLQVALNELDQFFLISIDLLCIASNDGRFLRLNPEWERTLGFPVQELEGKRFLDLIHPDDVEPTSRVMESLVQGSTVKGFVNRYRCKNGLYRHIEWNAAPGSEDTIYATAHDITERTMLVNALRLANVKLNLLTQISRHDLINQLFILMGQIEMAPTTPAEELGDLLKSMERRGKALIRIIESIKEYQELGTKEPRWYSWTELAKKAVEDLHSLDIMIEISGDDYDVYLDPLAIKAFHNLLDNALKYSNGEVKVQFIGEFGSDGSKIVVVDDGPGIDDETRKRLFMPGVGKGHGFGLYLSREILSITNIELTEVKNDRGARFEVLIPPGMARMKNSENTV